MHQVVFTGRLLKGAERATAETELQRLFKATPRQVEWFLRGKAIVVKSTEDAALARRYHEALTRAGLECELRGDQPATEPMAPPPETTSPAQRQLPIPGVAPRPPEPAAGPKPEARTGPSPAPRRTPTLGPVTQAITAQDRAPVFVARPKPEAPVAPRSTPAASLQLRTGLGLVFLLVGIAVVGALGYTVQKQWQARTTAGAAPAPKVATRKAAPKTADGAGTPEQAIASRQTPAPQALIVGRWQCVEAASGRVVENEFAADGGYRSLTHGRTDAFQQVDQLDVLVEGRYRIEGDKVVLHVQHIPSREMFGAPAHTDEYLYWRIDSLTPETMIWADLQLQEVRESCLRSQGLPPGPG
jgi:hypothetical protein